MNPRSYISAYFSHFVKIRSGMEKRSRTPIKAFWVAWHPDYLKDSKLRLMTLNR